MADGNDTAVLEGLLKGQFNFAQETIAAIKCSSRDAKQKQRACEQVVAGLTLAVGILIARDLDWCNLSYEEGMRLRQIYSDAIGALGVFA